MKTLLAFDLGTTTGWASINTSGYSSGTIKLKGGRFEGGGMRFLRFESQIQELFGLLKPDAVFYEEVRRHMGTDAAHIYGGLWAKLTAECERRMIPYQGFPVGTVKKLATGKGNAGKDAMIQAAKTKWPDQNITDDNQADALWVLETGRLSL